MNNQGMMIVVSLAIVAAVVIWKRFVVRLVIAEYEVGLLYGNGRFIRRLEPGAYHLLRHRHTWRVLDLRKAILFVAGQEVLSADNIGLRASLSISYEITDPILATHEVMDPRQCLYMHAQLALRSFVASAEVERILGRRNEAGPSLLAQVAPEAQKYGIRVHEIEIRDLMFPGDLKTLFAARVKARNEGQAILEKARAETAAMRCLVNAAGMMESHPSLLSLRWIQALEGRGEGSSRTVVVGAPVGAPPIKEVER